MSTHENGPLLDGWSLPPRSRCCGEWSDQLVCGTCGNYMPAELTLAPNIVLGAE